MYEVTDTPETHIPTIVTVEDALLLRQAREALRRIEEAAASAGRDLEVELRARPRKVLLEPSGVDWGRTAALADAAEDAIFNFLNTARHHADQDLIDLEVTR